MITQFFLHFSRHLLYAVIIFFWITFKFDDKNEKAQSLFENKTLCWSHCNLSIKDIKAVKHQDANGEFQTCPGTDFLETSIVTCIGILTIYIYNFVPFDKLL